MFIKMKGLLKKTIVSILFFSCFILHAQTPITGPGSCGSANGSYFSAGTLGWPITFNTANTNNLCYTIPKNSIPSQVCFEYILPSDSVYVSFSIRDCNMNTSSINQGTINGCNAATSLGGSVTGISTYNASCGLIANNASHGFCGGMSAGDKITVCLTLNTGACANDIIICPVLKCFSESCTVPPCPTVTPNVAGSNSVCNGKNITLTASGGTSYSWSTGATTTSITVSPSSTTTYTVTANDGCGSATFAKVVTVDANPTPSITSQNNVDCTGAATGSATVTASGGTPGYTYSWSPGGQTTSSINGLTTGAYNVVITDTKGCTSTQMVAITQPASAINTGISSQTNVGCTGAATGSATVTTSGGTPGYTYSWSPGGNTTASISGLTTGAYNVTITDLNGCTSTQMVAITQPASAINSGISSQTNVGCTGAATGSATVTTSGGTPGYTYSWSPGGETTSSINGLTTGSYNVTITDLNGCTSTQMVAITQPASAINSGISSQTNVGCTGAATGSTTVTTSGGTPGYTYSWSPGGNTTASISGLTTGAYNVTITDLNGCTTTQTVAITQPASNLSSGISSKNDVACTGSATGSVAVTATGGTPGYTYSWSPGGNTTASISGLTTGAYNVTITDNNGCTSTQSVAITQPASVINSGISSQNNVGCTGAATGSATVTATGGTPGYTYSWSPGGETTSSINGLTTGSYNVTITDLNGCTSTQNVTIMQPASSLNSTTGSINATCGNSNGVASITASGGTPGYTYNWSPSGGTNSTATNLAAGPYTVITTDANGCTKMDAISVNNSGAPTVGIATQTNILCNGAGTGSVTVTATGGTGTLVYSWSPGGQTTTSISGLTAGTYIVTVVDSNSCAQGQNVIITEPASAVSVGISSQNNVGCTGSASGSATVTATGGTGILTYLWSPGGQTTTSISGLTSGAYNVTITDGNGCTTMQTVAITQPASALNTGISGQGNVNCTGSATGSTIVTASGGTPNYSYSWSPGGQTTASISGLTSGSYNVIITDNNGCTSTQTVVITQPASVVSASVVSTNAACGNANGTVTVTAIGGTPGYLYNWNIGETTTTIINLSAGTYSVTITDNNGCTQNATATVGVLPGPAISGTPSNNITCYGLNNGTITVNVSSGTLPYTYLWSPNVSTTSTSTGLSANTYTVIVTDSAGCADTATVNITEPSAITFTISSGNATICAGESLTLSTNTPVGGTSPYTFNWLPNGPVVSPLVPTTYSVSVTDSSGCVSLTDTIRIVPLTVPVAGFDTLTSGMFNEKYSFIDKSTGATTWYWDFGDGTISTMQYPNHTFPGAGTYTVTQIVTGASGCPDTITKMVVVLPNIIIPNVFTPNHDGINDEFWIPNTGFESFELVVYDRWGIKLFVTDQGEIRWDGRTSAGNEVPDGTYYFLLKAILIDGAGGKNYDAKGFIDLHRGN